jgi:hypothetical protein
MTFVNHSFTALKDTDPTGINSVSAQAVAVRNELDATYATIYSDNGITTIPQPGAATDANGVLEFWVIPGIYTITSGSRTETVIIDDGNRLKPLTVAEMTASKHIRSGEVAETAEFSTGNGGGGVYDVVLTSGVTPNAKSIIIGIADALISFVLRVEYKTKSVLASTIKTSDFRAVTTVHATGMDAVGDETYKWVQTGSTVIGKAGTDELWHDRVYDVNGVEFKASPKRAYNIIVTGQSNGISSTEITPVPQRTIDTGNFGFNKLTRDYETPVWGTNPMPSTLADSLGLRAANEIIRQTGRPVYWLVNCFGGESISEWIGAGVSSVRWAELLTSLTDSNLDANHTVDLIVMSHGEADGDDQATAYNTRNTYKTALNTWFDQLAALSCFTQDTKLVSTGVGDWNDAPNPERNDVHHALNNDDNYPWAMNVSTTGLVRNPDSGQESHFDVNSITTLGSLCALQALGLIVPETKIGPNNQSDSYVYGAFATTATLDRTFLKNDCTIQSNAGVLTWPDKPVVWDGATTTIDVTSTATSRTQLISTNSDMEYQGLPLPSSILLNRTGAWKFLSSQGKLKLISRPKASTTSLSFQNATFTPALWELEDEHYTSHNATINLPDPSSTAGATTNRTGTRFSVMTFSVTSGSTIIGIDGGTANKFRDKTGTLASTLTMAAVGNRIELVMQGGLWVVSSQNF